MRIRYDPQGDVLYIALVDVPATRGVEDHGLVWRYGPDGIVGVTVMDFGDYWSKHRDPLEAQIAEKFSVSHDAADRIVNDAIGAMHSK